MICGQGTERFKVGPLLMVCPCAILDTMAEKPEPPDFVIPASEDVEVVGIAAAEMSDGFEILPGSRERRITAKVFRLNRWTIGLLAILCLTGSLLVTRLDRRHHHDSSASTATSGAHVHTSSPAAPTPTLSGAPLTGATGVMLVLTGNGSSTPYWYSLDDRRRIPIGVPAESLGYSIAQLPDGALLQAGTTQPCAGCPGPPTPVLYTAAGSQKATAIGASNADIAVVTSDGSIWLSSYLEPDKPYYDPGQSVVAQWVTRAGKPLGSPVRLPVGFQLDGRFGQPEGDRLLLARAPVSTTRDYVLWDPRDHRTLAKFRNVVGVGRDIIVTSNPDCLGSACTLVSTDLTTGTASTVQLPPQTHVGATAGRYNPGQTQLALLLSFQSAPSSATTYILDQHAQTLMSIPGTSVDLARSVPVLTWEGGGRWLILANTGDSQHLGVIDIRTGQLHVAPLPG